MMPALQITVSRREVTDTISVAACLIEAKEARSMGTKVRVTEGLSVLHSEIRLVAAEVLRPVKMMWEGLWGRSSPAEFHPLNALRRPYLLFQDRGARSTRTSRAVVLW